MNIRSTRGFTIAETLTVLVIVGLLLSVVAFSVPLFLKGPQEAQSQVDNVQSTALALYKMQHDTRPSNIFGVFTCNTSPVVSCSAPAPPVQQVNAMVVVTANGAGQFQLNSNGAPAWSGFIIYYLTPNADGSSNELRRIYLSTAILNNNPMNLGPADAVTALTSVLGLPGYTTVAQDVKTMSVAIDKPRSTVDLQIDGGDKNGNVSSLQLSGNSYVRN
jgi:prepilin-type N-terminal cleavage/methylation domain-containing protein